MKFKTDFEAFDFILSLRNKLLSNGEKEACKLLTELLRGGGATTGTEAKEMMIEGLKEFLIKFPNIINDLEKQQIEYAIMAYYNALPGTPL